MVSDGLPAVRHGLDPRGERGRRCRPGDDETVSLLTEAVQLSDRSGEDPRLGVLARLRLGSAHAARGRWQEAATVLEEVLAGPPQDGDEAARARASAWLAFCALRLGEPDRAARQYALAAAEARLRADRHHGAALSHRAAQALGTAGAPEKAARAYERAADLWRSVGDHGAAARSLRARARQVRTVWGTARAGVVLEEALREARRGLRGIPGAAERDRLRAELVAIRAELTDLLDPAAGVRLDVPGTDDDTGCGLWLPPDPYEVSGRYQVSVYGDVGGVGPSAATAPRTRVQGCV
ncbi:tetratricopeptide repeat protein [Streptomyces sp. NPDC055103]